jgi:hypothetical protein
VRPGGNALKHGLRARAVLLRGEEGEAYAALRDALFEQWSPRGEAEGLLVQRMAECAWRLMRCAEIEAELLETLRDPERERGGLARAFLRHAYEPGGHDPLARLVRYETAIERSFYRAARLLRLLQMPWREAARAEPGDGARGTERLRIRPPSELWRVKPRAAQPLEPADRGSAEGGLVEVEEAILDGEEGPEPLAEGDAADREEASLQEEDHASGEDGGGPMRPNPDKFPNGTADEDPPLEEPPALPEPVSRVIAGPRSVFAGGRDSGRKNRASTDFTDWVDG